ncbi:MAG: DUF1254 domain-containing protein [Rhizobiaceae bacterium]|nr:DUF1254 domain-containing protein [Rhizobiaceae bacterium]
MLRLAYALALGLLGAGIVHIVVLLLVPGYSERDAWSRLAEMSGPYRMTRIDAVAGGEPLLGATDPLFVAAACRFDLSDGMVQMVAQGRVPFWSASVYDRAGRNVYNFNDRASQSGALDLVVLTHAQMVEVRKQVPDGFQRSLFVEAEIGEGIILVRAFSPDGSWSSAVSDFLGGMSCELR